MTAPPVGRAAPSLAVAFLLFAVTACSSSVFEPTKSLTRPCAVIVDASGSATDFRAEERLDGKFAHFLTDQGCGQLSFAPLNSLSDHSACHVDRLNLDPQEGDPNAVRPAMQKLAVQRAHQLLDCARTEPDNSDVLGALRKVGDTRPPGEGTYAVFVDSDMIQIDDRVNMLKRDLSTPEARAKVISDVADLTPRLPGTVLFPTDLGANIDDARTGQDVRAFWTELRASTPGEHPTLNMTYA